MMYQRDMAALLSLSVSLRGWVAAWVRGCVGGSWLRLRRSALAQQAEQAVDDRAERAVDAEEEDREQAGHDHHHDRGHHRLLPGRPDDLGRFRADLPEEFAGIDSRHVRSLRSLPPALPARLRAFAASRAGHQAAARSLRTGAAPPRCRIGRYLATAARARKGRRRAGRAG